MPKSTYGEGSTWYDEKRDLWFGQIYFGPQSRPRVSARTKSAMLAKLAKLSDKHEEDTTTTGEWIDRWLSQVKRSVEQSTHEDYVRWARVYVKPYVGAIPLDSLDAEDVEDMMSCLEAKGLAPKTVQLARTLLVSALDVAVARNKMPKNTARLTKGPRRVRARINDRLDVAQTKAVLASLVGDRLYALAVLALTLGIRPGELFGLQWNQVNLRTGTIRITANLKRNAEGWYLKGPKTEASKRPLPLPAFVLAALKTHQAQQKAEKLYRRDSFVFCDKAGEPLKARDVLSWWHAATIEAGVGRRRFYCSRHTAATLMLNNGVDLEVVSKILGHAGYAITADVYAEVQEDLQRDAADVMDGVLGS
jgi:integrase